jgi:hypothetical protein
MADNINTMIANICCNNYPVVLKYIASLSPVFPLMYIVLVCMYISYGGGGAYKYIFYSQESDSWVC